jgi:hypothetical protein
MGLIEPKEFPYDAFDPVSLYRVPYLLANSYPQSCFAQPVLLDDDDKVLCMAAFP